MSSLSLPGPNVAGPVLGLMNSYCKGCYYWKLPSCVIHWFQDFTGNWFSFNIYRWLQVAELYCYAVKLGLRIYVDDVETNHCP